MGLAKNEGFVFGGIMLLVVAGFIALGLWYVQHRREWQVCAIAGERFSIEMPGKPKRMTMPLPQDSDANRQDKGATVSIYRVGGAFSSYSVSVYDLLATTGGAAAEDQFYDVVRRRLQASGVEVISETPVAFDGHAGLRLKARHKKRIMDIEIFHIDRRLYQLQSVENDPAETERFFTSFHPWAAQVEQGDDEDDISWATSAFSGTFAWS